MLFIYRMNFLWNKGAQYSKKGIKKLEGIFTNNPLVHVLVVGETGAGKSTFLNFMNHYSAFSDLLESDFEDQDLIKQIKNIVDSGNECYEKGKSMTQCSKKHEVTHGKAKFVILDTPGMGDTRGLDQNKQNLQNIIDTTKQLEFINAICIVANGTQERLTISFKYVFNELQAFFPKTVMANIFLVATRCSLKTDIKLPFDQLGIQAKRVYCIDNPFTLVKDYSSETDEREKDAILEKLRFNTKQGIKQIEYLYEDIGKVESCNTNDFLTLYKTKQEIELQMLNSLTAINQSESNEKEFNKVLNEIQQLESTKDANVNFEYEVDQDTSHTETRSYHSTLCGHPKCYSTCHEHCGLAYSTDKQIFLGCAGVASTNCTTCGHSYTEHMHNHAVWIKEIKKVKSTDEHKKKQFSDSSSQLETIATKKRKIEEEITKIKKQREENQKKLNKALADFNNSSMINSFKRYLNDMLALVLQYKQAADDVAQKQVFQKTADDLNKFLVVSEVANTN